MAPTPRFDHASPPQPPQYQGIWFRPDRPKIVGMTGWLCAALGYLGFVLKGSQLPMLFMDMKWLNPNVKPMPYNREQFAVSALILIGGMVISLLCIAGAMGALRMRHWGRRTLIWYAIIGLIYTLAKAAWQVHMFDFMLDYQASTTQPFDRESMGNRQFFAMVVMTGIMCVWAAIVLIIMSNRTIADAFTASENGDPVDMSDWRSREGSR